MYKTVSDKSHEIDILAHIACAFSLNIDIIEGYFDVGFEEMLLRLEALTTLSLEEMKWIISTIGPLYIPNINGYLANRDMYGRELAMKQHFMDFMNMAAVGTVPPEYIHLIPICEMDKMTPVYKSNWATTSRVETEGARGVVLAIKILIYAGLDPECVKYWDYSDDDFFANLGRCGYTAKAIATKLIDKVIPSLPFYKGTFLESTFNIRHLANIMDFKEVIMSLAVAPTMTLRYRTLSDNVTSSLIVEAFMGRIDNEVINGRGMNSTPFSSLLMLYFNNYKHWLDDASRVMVDGTEVYVHHHTVVTRYAQLTFPQNIASSLDSTPRRLPESTKVHPSKFLKNLIEVLAESHRNELLSEISLSPFPDLPPPFKKLDPTKWSHLKNASELILEGDRMQHCVGGRNYIDSCSTGSVFIMHYNDGSRFGYTIEFHEYSVPTEMNDNKPLIDGFLGKYEEDGYHFSYDIIQVKGIRNTDPDRDTIRAIVADLLAISNSHAIEDAAERKRELHQERLMFATRFRDLRTIDTRWWGLCNRGLDYVPYVKPDVYDRAHLTNETYTNTFRDVQGFPFPMRAMHDRRPPTLYHSGMRAQDLLITHLPGLVPYQHKTGRDHLVGMLHGVIKSIKIPATYQRGQSSLPFMARFYLSLLERKSVYGFMSDDEIERWCFRLAKNGVQTFKSGHGYSPFRSPLKPMPQLTDFISNLSVSNNAQQLYTTPPQAYVDVVSMVVDNHIPHLRALVGHYGVKFNQLTPFA